MNIHELLPAELPEALELRNSIFSHVGDDHWQAMNCTGVVARAEDSDFDEASAIGTATFSGRLIGFIPLQYRNQLLRPGLSVPVVYENAVGVHEQFRSRGIGGRMLDATADFIADRVDALFVIRGGEDSVGYRFYRKSGHGDLCYQTCYLADHLERRPVRTQNIAVSEVDRTQWLENEAGLNEIHHAKFGEYGGGRTRGPGYWREIISGHVFREKSWRFYLAFGMDGLLTGYALVAFGTWEKRDIPHVYEITATNDDSAVALLTHIAKHNPGELRVPSVSLANPIRTILHDLGFDESRSEPQIMARIIHPERLFRRLVADTPVPDWWHTLTVTCSTPHRTLVLQNPDRTAVSDAVEDTAEVFLEMKEHMLSRLLCCRVDFGSAVEHELIRFRSRSVRNPKAIAETLSRITRPAPWVQWFTDYV